MFIYTICCSKHWLWSSQYYNGFIMLINNYKKHFIEQTHRVYYNLHECAQKQLQTLVNKIKDNFVSKCDRYRSWSGTETVLFESVAGYERFLDIDIRSVSLEHRLFRLNPLTLRLFFSDVEYCALVRYSHNLTSQVLENNFRRTF